METSDSSKSHVESAYRFVDALAQDKLASVSTLIDAKVADSLTSGVLSAAWRSILVGSGNYQRRLEARVETLGPYIAVFVPAVFERNVLDIKIVFLPTGGITGFFIEPHRDGWQEAPYVKAGSYVEKSVKIGSGPFQLNGTLTLSKTDGPLPGLVLIHGSGPQDADETIGANKPFRDLAHGLATRGIAVLRYEKRTRQHQAKMSSLMLESFTVMEETIDDALHAVEVLSARPEVDKNRVFVLGHSLGGMLLPRLAGMTSTPAGYVFLAGSNLPLPVAMLNQTDYLIDLGGDDAKGWQEKRKEFEEAARKIENLSSLSGQEKTGSDKEMILGAPPSYWLDLRDYRPLEQVRNLRRPALFLQGAYDYQVTVADDFENWRKALADSEDLEKSFSFKIYDDLDHLFMPCQKKSTPADYFLSARNVSGLVVDDIANWILSQGAP